MILLRRVIGDALRARRQAQHRTLREVSTAANVSLGYLSEIERGQKEASSELLASVCEALGARLSEVLREVSFTVASSEREKDPGAGDQVVAPEQRGVADAPERDGAGRPDEPGAVHPDLPEEWDDASEEREPAEAVAMAGASHGRQQARPVALATASGVRQSAPKANAKANANVSLGDSVVDGSVAVMIRRDTPLSTTLRTRNLRRDVLSGV